MKLNKVVLIIILAIFPFSIFAQNNDVIYKPLDQTIFKNYIKALNQKKQSSVGNLVIQTAVFLMDSPYASNTLEECGNNEKLVINLRQFDCVTLVENCLALVHTLKSKDQSFSNFYNKLRNIRYRNGEITDYSSRLHYFNEWIANNETKGNVINLSASFGGKLLPIKTYFMSQNPKLYPQLSNQAILLEMKEIEKSISERRNIYLQKSIPANDKIRNGDILCLTSNKPGIGISHVGLAFRLGADLYFLHASQSNQKVEISSSPFNEYLAQQKNITGYIVVRPL